MVEQPRPDEIYLESVIQEIEKATGEWDMKDELAQEGDVVSDVAMCEIFISFKVKEDATSEATVDLFVAASAKLVEFINEVGYNVCRPLGILDPSLQAKDGTIQLCKRGSKISVYMSHRFDDGTTTVTLKMLVGVK